MNQKKLLMGILAVMLGISTSLKGDYISEAARMLNNKDVELSKLKENFSKEDVRKIENKAKELKLENLKKQKELEEEQQEAEKEKKLQEISNKNQKQKAKENILIEDLNKTLTNVKSDVDTLKRKVSNLEQKQTSTKSSDSNSKKIKSGSTSTTTSSNSKKISKKEAADLIIRGKLGDGEQRKESLKKLGFKEAEIKEIQKEVNRIIETDHIKVNLD